MDTNKLSSDIKKLLDAKNELPKEVSFISFQPEMFLEHLYYSMGAMVVIPFITSYYFESFPEDTFTINFFGVCLGITLLLLFILFRINAHKRKNKKAETGEIREGLFINKEMLMYKKGKLCQVFPRRSITEIRTGWILNPDGADDRGIKITFDDDKEFEFAEEYFNGLDTEKLLKPLNNWLKDGKFSQNSY